MPLDRFSTQAATYARYRIDYPAALYDWLLPQVAGRQRAWDCATGNGQVAAALAPHFQQIEATDLSANQLSQAPALPNVRYQVAPAEHSPFPDHCFDLVTVGQALHWFDAPAWHREATRVLRPGSTLAEWGYGTCCIEGAAVHELFARFYETSAPYWDANRRHIEDEYARIPLPLADVQTARFSVARQWTAADMLGYLRSWSAAANYARQHAGADMVALVAEELTRQWGPGERTVTFPVFARAGRV